MSRYSCGSRVVSTDRMSSLHDNILCHILSFLPTRNAVQTTLLSPGFANLWKNITRLRFCCHLRKGRGFSSSHESLMRFIAFVNRVLLTLETSSIDEFAIEWSGLGVKHVDVIHCNLSNWVVAAVARKVKRVIISMSCFGLPGPWFVLPSCIYTCASLEVLDVSNSVVFLNTATSVYLPNLRILRLEICGFEGEDFADNLISGCPSLHTLYLRRKEKSNVVSFSVCSQTLEHLTIISTDTDFSDDEEYEEEEQDEYLSRLQIDAPSLIYLHLDQDMLKYLSMKMSPSLIEAEISLGHAIFRSSSSYNLVQSLSNVKVLSLDVSDNWLDSFGRSSALPMFPNLNELTLYNVSRQWNLVKDLLQRSPTLVTLALKFVNYTRDINISSFQESNPITGCMTSLKMVTFDNYFGSLDQLKMLKYILLHVWLCKKMEIKTPNLDTGKRLELLQEIPKFRRKFGRRFMVDEVRMIYKEFQHVNAFIVAVK